MRKHGSTPSWRDQHVTPAAISPPGVARGRFVGGQQSGLAGCKPPPLFKCGPPSCLSERQRQREPWGASPRPSAPTYLPCSQVRVLCVVCVCCLWLCRGPPLIILFCPCSLALYFVLLFGALVLFYVICIFFDAFSRLFICFWCCFFRGKITMEKEARAHCRHRHEHLVLRCSSAAFFRCWCFVGGRTPGVLHQRLDVHGCG